MSKNRFKITWDSGAYSVNIPNYDGGEVVPVADYERLARALEEIRDHWACQYDHPNKSGPMYSGSYGIGVTDGHRLCADIARKALNG